ncbi:MAG: hypothetical protein MK105_05125 [Crocinitomicaceae bacterium]|nr:hypothetical protein [Crocinitomicaceae bacterium]
MNIFLSKSNVESEFNSSEFVIKTQKQIAKDFSLYGIMFDKQFENTAFHYNQIIDFVAEKLIKVMQLGESQLLQLLYQIDIPQNHFLELLNKTDFPILLSDLIIRREAYKVHLRYRFS